MSDSAAARALPATALPVAMRAARAAGAVVRQAFVARDGWTVQSKGAGDLVTDIDRQAEACIAAELRKDFASHAILGEEGGLQPAAGADDYTWVVDPIDGTMNFAHGLPHFCVSIALSWRSQTLCAVVYDPLREEMFSAAAGRGAWLGSRRLRASSCQRLDQALLAAVFPKPGSPWLARFTPTLLQALHDCAGVRRSGSMVLDLAYVASARLDGFWQWGMQPWDIAAGELLVREAGGHVEAIDPAPALLQADGLLACGPALADALGRLCRQPRAIPH